MSHDHQGRTATATPPAPVFDRALGDVLAEGLFMPTGLLATIYLARRLGPPDYALVALATAVVAPLEWLVTAPFADPTVDAVRAARDWRPVGAAAMRRQLLAGVGASLLLWTLAPALGIALALPGLTPALRLLALDIPLFTLALAQRDVLIGLGRARQRALGNAGRMLARPILIALLVESGLGIRGALLGTIGVSIVHLSLGYLALRPHLSIPALPPAPRLPPRAGVRLVGGLALQLRERLDLLALAAVGVANLGAVGVYGAAQFLTLLPGTIALAFMPPLAVALGGLRASGDEGAARALARDALRAAVLPWPFAALAAGAAPELTVLLFGSAYSAGAAPLAILAGGAAATIVLIVAMTLLRADDRPILAVALAGPLPFFSLIGQLALAPRHSVIGIALATAAGAGGGALAMLVMVGRTWRAWPPGATVLRSTALCVPTFVAARWWPTPGLPLVAKLAVIGLAIPIAWAALGEARAGEKALLRSLFHRSVGRRLPG